MQPVSLSVKPTCDTQGTPLAVGQGMIDCNLIRIRNGHIEKLPLSTQLVATAFTGVASWVQAWQWHDPVLPLEHSYVAVGTGAQVALIDAPGFTDISPITSPPYLSWVFDTFNSNLIAALFADTIYEWVPPVAGGNVLVAVTGAPSKVTGLVVAAPEQQVMAWGIFSAVLGEPDPLLVGWCDVANINVWTATATNQAGTFRIPTGSVVRRILWYGLSGLLWTDLEVWAITYVGFPLIYGFNKIAQNCGLIGMRAVGQLNGRIAWMSYNDFFIYYGGQIQLLPCSVRDFVFGNLDRTALSLIHCDTNTYGNEFMWRFPTVGSGDLCNAYVKWQPDDNVWDKGFGDPMISAWTDQTSAGPPMGADYTGLVQQFETSLDFNGTPLTSSFTTGWFQIAETEEFLFIERILPDFVWTQNGGTPSGSSQVQITINFADEVPPLDTDYPVRTYGPYIVTPSTPYIIVRGRGRVAQLIVECSAANTFWRYGKPPAVASIDGRN